MLLFVFASATMADTLPPPLRAAQADALAKRAASAPVESFEAIDRALQVDGASGRAAELLKTFDLPPQKFRYTMQPVEDEDGVRAYRLVFPSPFKSPFAQNNVIPAEYYVPANATGPVPAAIVLDILHGSAVIARGIARSLASQGVAAVYMPMAYYGGRRPDGYAHLRWLEANPTHAADPATQTVMDIRRAKAILAARPEVDPKRIGITGVSLGGIMASLAAGVDGEFYRVVPILAGGDVAHLTFHTRETRRDREMLLAHGIDQQKLEAMFQAVEPLNFASRIDLKRCLMINAKEDEVIPGANTLALWRAIGKPMILWVPTGHYGAATYLPTIKQTAIDFLKGRKVDRLEF